MPTNTRKITMTAVMAALVFVMTYMVKIPIPALQGAYANAGDIVVYICAYLLGGPATALAAAVGSGLADAAFGAAYYIFPTILIKAAMGLAAGALTKPQTFPSYLTACLAAGMIMVGGYAGFEYFAFGAAYMLAGLPANLGQFAVCVTAALVLYKMVKTISSHFNYRIEMKRAKKS